jgi:hypothetical protein
MRRKAERMSALSRLLSQILKTGRRVERQLRRREHIDVLRRFADSLGIDLSAYDDVGYELMWSAMLFSAAQPGDVHAAFCRLTEVQLGRRARQLLRLLRHTPLQVWCLHADRWGDLTMAHPLFVGGSDRLRPVDGLVGLVGQPTAQPGAHCAWPIVFQGGRSLLLGPRLDQDGVTFLGGFAEEVEARTGREFWDALHLTILDAVMEPFAVDVDDRPPLEETVDAELLLRAVVARADRRRRLGLRLRVAEAGSKADLASVVDALRRARHEALPWFEQDRELDDPEVEALLPMARILSHYGVAPDGSMGGDRMARLERQPVGVLDLDAVVLEAVELHPALPVRAAADWARFHGDDPAAKAISEALGRYRLEQRWLATFDASEADGGLPPPVILYDHLIEGFEVLFPPEFLDVTLVAMGVTGGALSRLQKAFERDGKEPPETLGDLPTRSRRIEQLQGVGPVTIEALVAQMLEHARQWRFDRANLSPVETMSAREGAEDLEEGLDELAALFD